MSCKAAELASWMLASLDHVAYSLGAVLERVGISNQRSRRESVAEKEDMDFLANDSTVPSAYHFAATFSVRGQAMPISS